MALALKQQGDAYGYVLLVAVPPMLKVFPKCQNRFATAFNTRSNPKRMSHRTRDFVYVFVKWG